MKKIINSIALLAALTAGSAQATKYDFTYIFGTSPITVVGSFEGDAQGDLITNLSHGSFSINGIDFKSDVTLEGYTLASPVASFSGASNDFIFTQLYSDPSQYTIFWMTDAFDQGTPKAPPPYQLNVAYDSYNRFDSAADAGFVNSWKVTAAVAAVPEPETYAMLLAGLALTGFVARRRKQS